MEPKYSLGPWSADLGCKEKNEYGTRLIPINAPGIDNIAVVHAPTFTNESEEDSESIPNALLIAAAPDLFVALENYCKVVKQFLDNMPDEYIVDIISGAYLQEAHRQAKEAIKKATLTPQTI